MTAGDEARIPSGWVPTDSPPDPAAVPLPQEPETQPLTRASIRAAEAKRLAEEAEERRLASLAEEAAVPRAVRVLAVVTAVALAVLIGVSALVGPNSTALAVGFASVVLAWGLGPADRRTQPGRGRGGARRGGAGDLCGRRLHAYRPVPRLGTRGGGRERHGGVPAPGVPARRPGPAD